MGRIICCGLGPGDPDLMSVRADREVRAAKHVAYFRKKGRPGQARRIVEGMLAADVSEYPMEYPVTTEIAFDSPDYVRLLAGFYDEWAERLARLARAVDVVVLCEGDPYFYGSFMHLHTRLQGRVEIEVIAGIPGMAGCWNSVGQPIALGRRRDDGADGHARGRRTRTPHAQFRCARHHEDRPQSAQRCAARSRPPAGSTTPGWSSAAPCRANASCGWPISTKPTVPTLRSCSCTARGGAWTPPNDGHADHRGTRAGQ